MQGSRPERVGDQIRAELSELIAREVKDPGIGFVTITYVSSKPIGDLAKAMDDSLPDGPEKSAGLRKLLEAKDCLVRAKLS